MTNSTKKVNKSDWLKGISIGRDGRMVIPLPFKICSEPKYIYRDYVGYDIDVDCAKMVELPTDGNPRGINDKSPSFKDVTETITGTTTTLQDNSVGGDIFANFVEIDRENKVMNLTFCSTEMGAVNGATTMGAILKALYLGTLTDGNVMHFRVRDYHSEALTKAQRFACVQQAANLNSVLKQTDDNLCYQLGYLDTFIEAMKPEYRKLFVFKTDNDEDCFEKYYSSNLILRLLEGMHINKYSPTSVPTCLNRGVGGMMKGFRKQMSVGEEGNPYTYLTPMLNDFIELYAFILYHWDDDLKKSKNERDAKVIENLSKKFNNKVSIGVLKTPFGCLDPIKYNRPKGNTLGAESFHWAIYTAFRANISYNAETKEIGWRVNPMVLWDKCNISLLREVNDSFMNICKGATTGYVSCVDSWRRLYNIVIDAIYDIEAEKAEIA